MAILSTSRLDRAFLIALADWLVVAVAIALPWSTSGAAICITVWLVVLLPTLDVATVKREVLSPAGGLPVLLWCLGAIGMLWADVDWPRRFGGLDGFHRLLMIPLLLAQFRRSGHGNRVLWGFLISCGTVLIVSYVLAFAPGLPWRGNVRGIPVHDDIFQCAAFVVCAFTALGVACRESRQHRWRAASAFSAIAALFLGNIAFVFASRISLVVAPILAVLLGWRELGRKGIAATTILVIAITAICWFASPYLRGRVNQMFEEMRAYRETNQANSTGMHTAFLRESLTIIASAPVIGHGTGSIPEQFRQVTVGGNGAGAVATVNPHNQTFAVAIQIGVVGALVLWAMWIAHLYLFRGTSLIAWFGLVVVAENIISSAVHSHLFDFTNGWLYVFGVGVSGGMVLREKTSAPALTVQRQVNAKPEKAMA